MRFLPPSEMRRRHTGRKVSGPFADEIDTVVPRQAVPAETRWCCLLTTRHVQHDDRFVTSTSHADPKNYETHSGML